MWCGRMCASASDPAPRSRGRTVAFAAVGLVVALAGCFAAMRAASGPPRFDHAAHLKRDLACIDCHEGGATKDRAGMPPIDTCTGCHEPKDDRPEVTASIRDYMDARTANAFPTPAVHGPTYRDVKFSHKRHADAKVDCAKCHEGATKGALAAPAGPMAMDTCVDCHDRKKAANDCATCHSELGKGAQPRNHRPGWILHHGPVSRIPDRSQVAERCDVCHAQSDCDDCHARNPPRNHTNPFRTVGHGLEASIDRSRCIACHQADSCDRCHEVQPPRSHRAGFGAPQDRHCISCHLPVESSGCVACHKGTPSHALAPPKPPTVSAHRDDVPPQECLICHRVISHPVTLENCNLCHQ
jgi:hypothetical protein